MPIVAHVPASSANLGPGFDCLGLAVDLHCTVTAVRADRDRFTYRGNGHVPDTPDNLVHEGFRAVHERLGLPAPPIHVDVDNAIPLARGLGSSSAALVAGALIGDHASGGRLGREGAFQLVADVEGHPDNVAPTLFGGFTVSSRDDLAWRTRVLAWPEDWRLAFAVPAFELSTEHARSVLPSTLTRSDAVRTASRTALWTVAVLQRDPTLLPLASSDVAHEPYRSPLLPGFQEAREALRQRGAWAAFLSGAGPTLGVVCHDDVLPRCAEALRRYAGADGRVLTPAIGQAATVDGAL